MRNRKYATILIVLLLGLAAISFVPSQHGWAPAALLSLGGGILYQKLEKKWDIEEQEKGKRIFLFLVLAMVAGIVMGLINHYKWWAVVPAILDLVAFIAGAVLSEIADGEAAKLARAGAS